MADCFLLACTLEQDSERNDDARVSQFIVADIDASQYDPHLCETTSGLLGSVARPNVECRDAWCLVKRLR